MAANGARVKGLGFHFDAWQGLAGFPFRAYFLLRVWLPCLRSAVDPLTREEAVARHHIAALIIGVLCTASLAAHDAAVAVSSLSLIMPNNVAMLDQLNAGLGAQLDALTSQRFTEALNAHNVHLMTYRELIAKQGLSAMRRPAG